MTTSVGSASLADQLTDAIGSGRVVAALFSTFTFRRKFFEDVVLPLVTDEGRRRGLLPITVVLDRAQFEGAGWGYEVKRAPGGRTWHAKLVAVMIEEAGQRRTVFVVGSGNLTRNGWERNLEIFHLEGWGGWQLPEAVLAWLKTPWLRESAFANWAREAHVLRKCRHHQSIVGSLDAPLWEQLDSVWRGQTWSELHVVSPFGDVDGEEPEKANGCGVFFDKLLGDATSKAATLTVYLRGIDEDGKQAYGDPSVLERVSKRVSLRLRAVPAPDNRSLHAKLLAVRANGKWLVLVGSPNATGPAFVSPDANVELACELRDVGRTLPSGILPQSRGINLAAIVRPEIPTKKPRWECLESATYQPRRKRIILRWKNGYGPFNSRILLMERELDPGNVDLKEFYDRFLETLPRGAESRRYDPDFVPIEVPDTEPDIRDEEASNAMTPDDWLARLDSAPAMHMESDDSQRKSLRVSHKAKLRDRNGFRWRDRVVLLDQKLRGFGASISDARTKREVSRLRAVAAAVWDSHGPDEPRLTAEIRAWRQWVRTGLWQVLRRLDGRIALLRPLSRLGKGWQRKVPGALREFKIAG